MEEKEGAGQTGTKAKRETTMERETTTQREAATQRKKIELNIPQVAGSAVAAVVAAKMAFSFGVYGTILGAGLVSVIATCGGSIFQHFFSRTSEQVREAAEKAKPRARQVPVAADGRPVPETFRPAGTTSTTGPVTTSWRPGVVTAEGDATSVPPATAGHTGDAARTRLVTSVDADRTQLLTSADVEAALHGQAAGRSDASPLTLGDAGQDRPKTPADDDVRTQLLATVDADATRLLTPVSPGAADATRALPVTDATRALPTAEETMLLRADAVGAGPVNGVDTETRLLGAALPLDGVPDADREPVVQGKRVKSWKRPVLGAVVVFGVAMTGIASYEVVTGSSFSGDGSRVLQPGSWGGSGSSARDRQDTTPEQGPSTSGPSEGATPDGDEPTRGTGPTAAPDGDGGTRPTPAPTPSKSEEQPSPTPSASESDEPTTEPPSPDPSDDGDDAGQERGGTPTD